jgi:hypothetical protein
MSDTVNYNTVSEDAILQPHKARSGDFDPIAYKSR